MINFFDIFESGASKRTERTRQTNLIFLQNMFELF